MLANLTHMVAISGGVKVADEPIPWADHLIRKVPNED